MLARELPVRHLQGTTLLCLWLDSAQVYEKMQWVASSGMLDEVASGLSWRF